jgi:hypothetical protein
MNALFLALLVYSFLFLGLHDWVPLGRWNDLAALRSRRSLQTRLIASLVMAAMAGTALYFNWTQSPHPSHATRLGTLILFACYVPGMLRAWWVPYWFGVGLSPQFLADYEVMFGNTVTFLPKRHGITVNALHVQFHVLTLMTLVLAAVRYFR